MQQAPSLARQLQPRQSKDKDPVRWRAIYHRQELERRLRTYTQVWLRNPQVLDEDGDAAHFMALGV
eukprot:6116720-Pyramimonas_sp.AAC.1